MSLPERDRRALDDALLRLTEAQGGRPPALWLRDDDAVSPSAGLDRLLAIAGAAAMPLSLAVVPALAEPALAERLAEAADVAVLQHGYAHLDHSTGGAKKREFGPDRPVDEMRREIENGAGRLAGFANVVPIFVPPWNRIDPALLGALPALGFAAVSTYGDRAAPQAAPGLAALNTHVDPVAWRAGRDFVGRQAATMMLLDRLGRLTDGRADRVEPTGILTHHLVHDEETFAFLEDLLQCLAQGGLCRFVSSARWLGDADFEERTVAV